MKLHATLPGAANTITGYGEDYVSVNGARHESSVIVTAESVEPWDVSEFQDLSAEDFERLKGLDVEIVILGTGPRQRFPHPKLTAPLTSARVGLEVMDVKAACRTYNILVAEARKVAAALLLK
ncbi:MAG: Mth938-like domain-containing protein [Betaproteobacteria bacterium]